jgi:hypothetical protein
VSGSLPLRVPPTLGTSTQPASTKDMFAASIVHDPEHLDEPVEYSVFPATKSYDTFEEKAGRRAPKTVVNDGTVSAALDSAGRVLGAAFWNTGGGSVRVAKMGFMISVNHPIVLVLKLTGEGKRSGEIYIADPTHGTGIVHVRLIKSVSVDRHNRSCKHMPGHVGGWASELQLCVDGERGSEGPASELVLDFKLPEGGMAGSGVVKMFNWSSY